MHNVHQQQSCLTQGGGVFEVQGSGNTSAVPLKRPPCSHKHPDGQYCMLTACIMLAAGAQATFWGKSRAGETPSRA